MSSFTETSNRIEIKPDNTNLPNSTNIDFNYPSLNRKDLMYLSTVENRDCPLRRFKQLHTKRNWSINLYNLDIEGSSPHKFGAFNQKTDYTNKNDDIEKSSPMQLHIRLKKPEYNLSNSDIEYSQPTCVKTRIKRHLNPLEPKYNFSKCFEYPPYQPKFIRDSITVKDIEGAKPKNLMSHNLLRDSLKNDDVKDSWPRKPYIRKSKYDCMDYRDVTNPDIEDKIKRNPLSPFYTMNFLDGTKTTFGPIEKNKPQSRSMYKYKPPLNLKVDDIPGANIGSKNKYKKFKSNNYCYDTSDIVGAQSGTLLKGMSTKRNTNPLWPKYKYLGEEELKGYYANTPFGHYSNLTSMNKSKSFGNNNINDSLKEKTNSVKTIDIKGEKQKIKTPSIKSEENKKILVKNVKLAKNNKIEIGPDGQPDFKNFTCFEDVVEFDKNKYKKPEPYYSIVHDKFLIPPIEEYKRKVIKVNPNLRTFQEVSQERLKFMNKNKVSKILSDPHKTYANKLDDFMTYTNIKFNWKKSPKGVTPFLETGLPDNIEPKKKQTENKNDQTQNANNKLVSKAGDFVKI